MIPEAAVEAAAWEMFHQNYPTTWAKDLDELDAGLRDNFLTRARAVLEAAAPHMLPERQPRTEWPDIQSATVHNPYRSQT